MAQSQTEQAEELVGQRVFFPTQWEEATLDSILTGARGEVIAYVIRRDTGEVIGIDAQMRPYEEFKP